MLYYKYISLSLSSIVLSLSSGSKQLFIDKICNIFSIKIDIPELKGVVEEENKAVQFTTPIKNKNKENKIQEEISRYTALFFSISIFMFDCYFFIKYYYYYLSLSLSLKQCLHGFSTISFITSEVYIYIYIYMCVCVCMYQFVSKHIQNILYQLLMHKYYLYIQCLSLFFLSLYTYHT